METLFEEEKTKPKFQDENGVIIVNGVEVNYTFKNDYFRDDREKIDDRAIKHIEFMSDKPSIISETGYRSWFFDGWELNDVNSIKELIDEFVKICMKEKGIIIEKGQGTLI